MSRYVGRCLPPLVSTGAAQPSFSQLHLHFSAQHISSRVSRRRSYDPRKYKKHQKQMSRIWCGRCFHHRVLERERLLHQGQIASVEAAKMYREPGSYPCQIPHDVREAESSRHDQVLETFHASDCNWTWKCYELETKERV